MSNLYEGVAFDAMYEDTDWIVKEITSLEKLQDEIKGTRWGETIAAEDGKYWKFYTEKTKVKFYVYIDKHNSERYIMGVYPDGKVETFDRKFNPITDITNLGAPDIKELTEKPILEETSLNAYSEEAWMMNKVIASMNNEDAYFGRWLYIWPDGESREDCIYDFGTKEDVEDLRKTFNSVYKEFHEDGLYDAPDDVVAYAHQVDDNLGLAYIENIPRVKLEKLQPADTTIVGDILGQMLEPENIQLVEVYEGNHQGKRKIFSGAMEDMPDEFKSAQCQGFNVGDGHFVGNVSKDRKNCRCNVRSMMNQFDDQNNKNIDLVDAESGDELFKGTCKDANDRFGDYGVSYFETPLILRLTIISPDTDDYDTIEADDQSEEDSLVYDIIDANEMSQDKITDIKADEYWVNESITSKEDLKMIYENYVKPLDNQSLSTRFKKVTGYVDDREAAVEEGFNEANKAAKRQIQAMKHQQKKLEEQNRRLQSRLKLVEAKARKIRDKKLVETVDQSVIKGTGKGKGYGDDLVIIYKDGDDIFHGFDESNPADDYRDYLIDSGKDVDSWKYNSKLKRFELNMEGHKYIKIYVDPALDEKIQPKVNSFKNRAELSEAIRNLKNNNRPYSICRSNKPGFRYDLKEETSERSLSAANSRKVYSPGDYNYEILDAEEEQTSERTDLVDPHMADEVRETLEEIRRIAKDTSTAIETNYGIHADPALVVADIMQDLKLISGEININDLPKTSTGAMTATMYQNYNDFYHFTDTLLSILTGENIHTTPTQKFNDAIHMLKSPMFSTSAIFKAIGSDRFLAAAQQGAVPYLSAEEIQAQLTAQDQESAGTEEKFESVTFNAEQFDNEINDYFNENYDDSLLYTSDCGTITEDGLITLKGTIIGENYQNPIIFTLTPKAPLQENIAKKQLTELIYTVTNDLSEEVFEFSINK